jgi:adenosine kinase
MRTFVTGSIAYDYIMVFPGKFRDHILPEKMHVLSVSFLVDSLKRQRGGTGANIAYNLALLGNRPKLVGAVGEDFGEYRQWLERHGVDLEGVRAISGEFTSSCFINNDLQDNQITAFYPGAMAHAASVSPLEFGVTPQDLVVIAPNSPEAMARYAAECTERGIPYLYDPTMQLPRLSKEEFEEGCKGAKVLIGNDYEFGMMAEKLGVAEKDLHNRVPITVITRGEAGATIVAESQTFEIPAAKPEQVVDPTGAGDAFRAGLITGMARGFSWETAGRIAALTAVHAVEHMGPQEHGYSIEQFVERYKSNFGPSDEVDSLLDGTPVSA